MNRRKITINSTLTIVLADNIQDSIIYPNSIWQIQIIYHCYSSLYDKCFQFKGCTMPIHFSSISLFLLCDFLAKHIKYASSHILCQNIPTLFIGTQA